MKISIFGLGYVGCVTAACLAKSGHDVWGVDTNPDKVAMINAGKSPIIEKDLDPMIAESAGQGRLRATTDAVQAIEATELSLICVGTPSHGNGSLNLDGVKAVGRQIGQAIRNKGSYHCVVVRSTVLPGTVRNVLIPVLVEASGKQAHRDFDVCFNPEFLREGSSVSDFFRPPMTIIGQETVRGGDTLARMYEGVEAPTERVTYEVAEMVKYSCNSFHALKVAFANEIGVLCKSVGIDSHLVMELFAQDSKLNISPAYLKPGFAFGGSCLPKDLRAILYKAKEMDLQVPVLGAVLGSNTLHIQRVADQILSTKKKRIGVLGLSFKVGTDDLRESPVVTLIETLIGKGCRVRIHDSDVHWARIFGANRQYIEHEIPHISTLLDEKIDDTLRDAEIIIVAKSEKSYRDAVVPHFGKKVIVDLVRLQLDGMAAPADYHGVCW